MSSQINFGFEAYLHKNDRFCPSFVCPAELTSSSSSSSVLEPPQTSEIKFQENMRAINKAFSSANYLEAVHICLMLYTHSLTAEQMGEVSIFCQKAKEKILEPLNFQFNAGNFIFVRDYCRALLASDIPAYDLKTQIRTLFERASSYIQDFEALMSDLKSGKIDWIAVENSVLYKQYPHSELFSNKKIDQREFFILLNRAKNSIWESRYKIAVHNAEKAKKSTPDSIAADLILDYAKMMLNLSLANSQSNRSLKISIRAEWQNRFKNLKEIFSPKWRITNLKNKEEVIQFFEKIRNYQMICDGEIHAQEDYKKTVISAMTFFFQR